jgi:hypothetical protein
LDYGGLSAGVSYNDQVHHGHAGAYGPCRPSVMIEKAPMMAACEVAISIRHLCLIGIQHTIGQVHHVWLCRALQDSIIRQDTTAVARRTGTCWAGGGHHSG